MKTRPERIRYLRERVLRMDTGQFSKLIGVTRQALSFWERYGKDYKIAKHNVIAIARVSGASVEWILQGTGDPPPPSGEPNGESLETANSDKSWTGTYRSQETGEKPDRQSARDAIVAALETAFLVMQNRLPTEPEMAMLVRSSLELYEARRVLAKYRIRAETAQTRIEAPSRKDGIVTEP